MDHFAGLDVSVKETSVCIVDDAGKIVREVKAVSEPEALLVVLKNPSSHFKRIGLEAGPLSQWLYSALAEAELPAVCVETRHMQAVLKAQINKTDRNDARGIARIMQTGWFKEVRVKDLDSHAIKALLARPAFRPARLHGRSAPDRQSYLNLNSSGDPPGILMPFRASSAVRRIHHLTCRTNSRAAERFWQ